MVPINDVCQYQRRRGFYAILTLALLVVAVPQGTEGRVPKHSVRRLAQDILPAAAADMPLAAPVTEPANVIPTATAATPPAAAPVLPLDTVAAVSNAPANPVADMDEPAAPIVSSVTDRPVEPATVGAAEAAAAAITPTHASRPKLYLYAWCGVTYEQQDAAVLPNDNKDYVATIDATYGSSTFGKILSVASTPYVGTEAHHCNVDVTGMWFGAGGLLSFAYPSTPDIFMFDVSVPSRPVYKYGLTSTRGSCMDEFVAAKDGGFFVTSMCGRDGHPGGGMVKIDPAKAQMSEYTGGLNADQKKIFASHGIGVDYNSRRIVTADYLDVLSSVEVTPPTPQPPLGLLHTAHVWSMDTMKVLKVVNLTGITDGLMEARWSGTPGLFWVSGGKGKLHLIDTYTYTVTPNVYCFSASCQDVLGTCLTTDVFPGSAPGSKRMLVTSMSLAQMRLVDVTDPKHVKTLHTYQLPTGAGAHVVKYNQATGIAALATYLLDIKGTVLHFPSDQSVRLFKIDLSRDKIVSMGSQGVIDFKTAVPSKGSSNCHGLAFNLRYT